jgi:hypothetical protein
MFLLFREHREKGGWKPIGGICRGRRASSGHPISIYRSSSIIVDIIDLRQGKTTLRYSATFKQTGEEWCLGRRSIKHPQARARSSSAPSAGGFTCAAAGYNLVPSRNRYEWPQLPCVLTSGGRPPRWINEITDADAEGRAKGRNLGRRNRKHEAASVPTAAVQRVPAPASQAQPSLNRRG